MPLSRCVSTKQYIFEQGTDVFFYEFIEEFHELFVGDLIMTGTDKRDVHIEEVSMTMLGNDHEYCSHVLGGMLKEKPVVHIKYTDAMMCNMYTLCNDDDVEGVYMYQCVYEYPRAGYNVYTFWKCNDYHLYDTHDIDK